MYALSVQSHTFSYTTSPDLTEEGAKKLHFSKHPTRLLQPSFNHFGSEARSKSVGLPAAWSPVPPYVSKQLLIPQSFNSFSPVEDVLLAEELRRLSLERQCAYFQTRGRKFYLGQHNKKGDDSCSSSGRVVLHYFIIPSLFGMKIWELAISHSLSWYFSTNEVVSAPMIDWRGSLSPLRPPLCIISSLRAPQTCCCYLTKDEFWWDYSKNSVDTRYHHRWWPQWARGRYERRVRLS